MEWRGDDTKLSQLCQLFAMADSSDNVVQQQVLQMLGQFHAWPDFCLYLVTVFARMSDQTELVRQRAGLLLKTLITSKTPPDARAYILATTLPAVRNPSKPIRHTAGTIITTIVDKAGVGACRETLDGLAQLLGEQNEFAVEGSFNALNKICEDGVSWIRHIWDVSPEDVEPFISWSSQVLLPRVIEYASMNAPVEARRNALDCLNHFALNYLFNDERMATLFPFTQRYVQVLGSLAQDSDVDVIRNVCKGFVCMMENSWGCNDKNTCQTILQFMLKASSHPEYSVRKEALEVWTPCAYSPMLQLIIPMLPDLIPVLLGNMVYTQADYMGMEQSQIDDDNASVPDKPEEIHPRFHKEPGDDGDDGGGQGGGTWGAEWTARKAAASSLDNLASVLKETILPIVLPIIEKKLEDANWEVQESGVLAVGAIAFGCVQELRPFLPRIMDLLIRHCQGSKPLLRSISCWCASRFSRWICGQPLGDDAVLRSVLKALIERILDKNKRVQEAACSALATLEEEAQLLLVPYLDDVVQTLVQAFNYYQAKNLLILYDAVGTLADAVGTHLNKPQYVEALMTPLMVKFDTTLDSDRSICALFECISVLCQNLGESLMFLLPKFLDRCIRILVTGANASKAWRQNPKENERPDTEIMAASLDLVSGIMRGVQERITDLLDQKNFLCVIPEVIAHTPANNVKQSAFALVGDAPRNCMPYLQPYLSDILTLCASNLSPNIPANVCNNASWAIGEICVHVSPDVLSGYLNLVVPALSAVLEEGRKNGSPQSRALSNNFCMTLGRLGMVCGDEMGKRYFQNFASGWLEVMQSAQNDFDKTNAFTGLCNMIKANPQSCLNCIPALLVAICSWAPEPPTQLRQPFQDILQSYKNMLGTNWQPLVQNMPPNVQWFLSARYTLA